MDVRVGLWRKLSAKELMLLNCGVGEDSWESLELQEDPTSPFWRRSALGFLRKDEAKAEAPVLWPPHAKSWLIGKDSDAGKDWGQEEKGTTEDEMAGWHHQLDQREWLNSRSWLWTGRPGLLWFMDPERVGHDWVTELNWTELNCGDLVHTQAVSHCLPGVYVILEEGAFSLEEIHKYLLISTVVFISLEF